LYDLATQPEYLTGMREEAESVISAHGWTYSAMKHLRKIDSFGVYVSSFSSPICTPACKRSIL